MRSLPPIILSLMLLALRPACAQPADDFFNSGAQFYISNNIANAKQVVESGLKLYPEDVKLKKLEELLKQQQQQQQQNQNQKQQNQQNQQQPSQQNQQNQQNQQENQKPQDQQNQQNQQKDQPQQQNQATPAKEMSPEEAKRLLDAQKGDEQFLQLKPQKPPESPNRPIKDW